MPTVAVDFDGVISCYDGFKGKGIFGPPIPGVATELAVLRAMGWTIIVNTTRSETWWVKEYLIEHEIPWDYVNFNPDNHTRDLSPAKIIADVYIDDRAITFTGKWGGMAERVINFRPWYKRED